ncbi:MAG: CTP synthase [bacterium]
MRVIFITGGVISSLGKGVITASIASILEEIGLKVTVLKLDPYLNVDAGTMNPFEHGEVFVTFDGGETDLDIGHYERFTNIKFSKQNNITSGQIYLEVIEKERKGEFLGQTIQVIPHVTNQIKQKIYSKIKEYDVGIVEIGGTVGDIESLPFLEAARQIKIEDPQTIFIHITYVPMAPNTQELKTKPTQHSVRELLSIGIQPDFILYRTDKNTKISSKNQPTNIKNVTNKIALFSNLNPKQVIQIPNLKYIYQLPFYLLRNKFHKSLLKMLKLKIPSKSFITTKTTKWNKINLFFCNLRRLKKVKVGIVGKYTKLKDSYKSLSEALLHSSIHNNLSLEVEWIDSEKLQDSKIDYTDLKRIFQSVKGIVIAGGFGTRGIEGKIKAIKWARENNIPTLGICLGLQLMFIEFVRNVLGLKMANSTEFDPNTPLPVVDLLKNQKNITNLGGTMRLGEYLCYVKPNTLAFKVYNTSLITERHRHRYEINLEFLEKYKEELERNGMIISGVNPETNLVEIIELKDKAFFLGVQFHPEFNSRVLKPHPLFSFFLSILS